MPTRHLVAESFSALVRRIVLVDKLRSVTQVADSLGLSLPAFYARMRGNTRFNPGEIAILLRELPDGRLARWLFRGSDILVVHQPSVVHSASGDAILERAAGSAIASVDALLGIFAETDQFAAEGRPVARETLVDLVDQALAELLSSNPQTVTSGPRQDDSFTSLAVQVLLTEKQIRIKDLADTLNINYHILYSRITGRTQFDANEIRRLFRWYPEARLAEFFLRGTPFVAIPLPVVVDSHMGHSPLRIGLLALRDIVHFFKTAAGGHTDLDEAALEAARRSLNDAFRKLVAFRWTVGRIGYPQFPHQSSRNAIPRRELAVPRDAAHSRNEPSHRERRSHSAGQEIL